VEPVQERLRAALADRYTVAGQLGEGGMATVYRATDLKHHRAVAIKVLRPELAQAIGAERFLREIEIAAGLQHPRILPLYDSGEADGLLYYVMPLVEGESLAGRLSREKQLPLDEALRITREVASALSYAHARGIVHRDIKPDNILLSGGESVVADFGIARALDAAGGARLTATGMAIGTPVYMSPEQAAGDRDVDGRSDLYSLGCVLYEMVAGQPPFTGPTAESVIRQHVAAPAPRVTAIRPTAGSTLERAIERVLAKAPADRFATASQFAEALGAPEVTHSAGATARRPMRRAFIGVAAIALVAVAGLLLVKGPAHASLNPNLIAIAPFDVLAPGQELWHEGMADRLAHGLDDAGPLRTVSPTVVVRRWEGKADPASADALGQRTGAGLVVFGSIERVGADSLRLIASLRDVEAGHTLADREIRGSAERMDLLVDSATVVLLNELSRVRTIGAVRAASMGYRSLPAWKAFLRAEQFYRRTVWDSVAYYATRAVQLDSTFALARRRVNQARGWLGLYAPVPEGLRASDLSHGLGPRDSLLVRATQLEDLYNGANGDSALALSGRLYALLTRFTTNYPEDPEGWFELGEFIHHYNELAITRRRELEVWQRSIALDPAFGPSYFHAVELALEYDGLDSARRYAEAYVALDPAGTHQDAEAVGTRLVAELLRAAPGVPADLAAQIARLGENAVTAWGDVARWPDSAESGVQLMRQAAAHPDPNGLGGFPGFLPRLLAEALAYRGHAAEALATMHGRPPTRNSTPLLVDLALIGAVPAGSARSLFAKLSPVGLAFLAAPWWSATADSTALRGLVRGTDAELRQAASGPARERAAFTATAAMAWLALARRDTTAALRGFLALPDSVCPGCESERFERALLLSALRRNLEAVALLDGDLVYGGKRTIEVLWMLERARVNDRLGRRDAARKAYQYVADVWRNADPALQPYVTEARSALRRLGR
jgi:serine/threonine-protein kinase